jgi:hypothetical protein
MRKKGRLTISMTVEQAQAVEDALAYFEAISADNFGAGYEQNQDDRALRRSHGLAARFRARLTDRLEDFA